MELKTGHPSSHHRQATSLITVKENDYFSESKDDYTPEEELVYSTAVLDKNPNVIVSVGTIVEDKGPYLLYKTEPDGNCLFTALAGHLNAIHYLYPVTWDQCMVRKMVHAFIEQHAEFTNELFEQVEKMSRETYLRNLLQGCEVTDQSDYYGSAIDVIAFAMATKITACINSSQLGGNFVIYHNVKKEEVYNLCFSHTFPDTHVAPYQIRQPVYLFLEGRHYDLLIRKNEQPEIVPGEFGKRLFSTYYPNDPVHPYIPFSYITSASIYRQIEEKKEAYIQEYKRGKIRTELPPITIPDIIEDQGAYVPPPSPNFPPPSFEIPSPKANDVPAFRNEKPIQIDELKTASTVVLPFPIGKFSTGEDNQRIIDTITKCLM